MQLCAKGCHGKFVWAQGEAGEVTWKQDLLRATKLADHIGCGHLPKIAGVWVSTGGEHCLCLSCSLLRPPVHNHSSVHLRCEPAPQPQQARDACVTQGSL